MLPGHSLGDSLAIAGGLLALLSTLYPSLIYYLAKNKPPCDTDWRECPKLSLVIAAYDEPLDLLRDLLISLKQLACKPREVILAWDGGDRREVEQVLGEALRDSNIVYKLVYNSKPRGKAAALNDALRHAHGDYIAVIDIDDRPCCKDYFHYLSVKPGAIGLWKPRWNKGSKLQEAASALIEYGSRILYSARCRLKLPLLFLGSGTILHREVIDDVGLWSEDIILEDVEYGLRLVGKGYRLLLSEDAATFVGVPPSYTSLRKQQARWCKGASQLLVRRIGVILGSRHISLIEKLELIVYLAQYLVSSLWVLIIPLSVIVGASPRLIDLIGFMLIILLGIGGAPIMEILREKGYSMLKAMRVSGGAAALSASMTPVILWASLQGLIERRGRLGEKTPKRREDEGPQLPKLIPELTYSFLSLYAVFLALLRGCVLSPLILGMLGIAPLYTIIRYWHEL
ncbi:MAG: glycosyltransferase family 2 protein [Pyrodictiaceae archaeon]